MNWAREALTFGAKVRCARQRRAVRRCDDVAVQERTRAALMRRYAQTAFGRELGLRGETRREFTARICPRTYEEFSPWIELMKRGEADVLWPGQCAYYAVSSGTTQGRTKYLPITPEMLGHFRRTGLDSLCFYATRVGRTSVFGGRHLFLGGATALQPIAESAPFRAWAGDLSGITAMHLPRWAEAMLYEPGRAIAEMSDWPAKLQAIARRTAARDIRLLAGIPSWALIFAEELRRQTGRHHLAEVWPRLECFVHGGVPVDPFRDELCAALGARVNFHEVYPASEAFIAAQDDVAEAGLRLLTRAGVYYEFLPMEQFDENRLGELTDNAVPLAEVRAGVDYALVLTTPGGLCRYVIGDVVQFTSLRPPRLVYRGRTRLQLSAFGEHVIEKELTDALTAVCARRGVVLVNFHVAPLFADAARGRSRGRHEWWIEVRSPGAAALEPHVAADLDRELQRLNDDYEAKRKGGGLDGPLVRLLPEGTFEAWLRRRGKWGGQNKVPRCRSDRAVASELGRELSDRAAIQARDREISLAEP